MLRPPQRRSPRIASRTSALLLSLLFALSFLAQPCQSLPEVRDNFREIILTHSRAHTLLSPWRLSSKVYIATLVCSVSLPNLIPNP